MWTPAREPDVPVCLHVFNAVVKVPATESKQRGQVLLTASEELP